MKKNIILLSLLSATANITYAMEEEKTWTHIMCASNFAPNRDFQGNLFINSEEEQISNYFLDQIYPYDEDTKKVAKVPQALFPQLCVQANTMQGDRTIYFRQLVMRLRLQEIDLKSPQICITPKDLARILINIPTGRSYSIINGKKAKLEVTQYETEQDTGKIPIGLAMTNK